MASIETRVSLIERIKTVFYSRPLSLTNPAGWAGVIGLGPNASGKSVTIDSAMQLSTVWACVRLIAETVATLPLMVYKRDTADGRTVASNHPLYDILHNSPSADYTAVEFWEGVVVSLLLQGNAYAEKQFIGGRLVSLSPLAADYMSVERAPNGSRRYVYNDNGRRIEYREDDIFHIRGFGNGGDEGLSVITYARQSFGSAIAADESSAKLFANGLQVAGVLSSDQSLKPEQRTQLQAIMQQYAGSTNAQKLMILEAGLKFQQVTLNPEDAQMLQTRTFNVEEICRWFRVPPFMIGHTAKSTSWGTGLEQQMIGFLTFALRPWLTRIEQAIGRSLIPATERKKLYAEFKVEGLLRADSTGRANFYAVMVQNGIMSRNEARALENMAPKDGADELTVQSQNVPLGAQPAPAPAPVPAPANEANQ